MVRKMVVVTVDDDEGEDGSGCEEDGGRREGERRCTKRTNEVEGVGGQW